MDELLALMEDDPVIEANENEKNRSPAKKKQKRARDPKPAPPKRDPREEIALTVDARIGIRMMNRKIAGADLLSLISESPYYSPASLAAMSLAQLNKLLESPAAVIDKATVTGRTLIMSVGIVFSNSGTRISSSGNGFCILTIGSLSTGPAATVLLFGSAYGQCCKTCIPGKVVALTGPKLIPPKSGKHDTAVTFTVSTASEIQLVGDAKDYGLCKGKVSAKSERGQWVPNSKRCYHYVDTRESEYCRTHKKQNAGKVSQSKGLENIRSQHAMFPNAAQRQGRVMVPPQSQRIVQTTKTHNNGLSRFGNSKTASSLLQLGENNKTVPKGPIPTRAKSNNSVIHPSNPYSTGASSQRSKNSLLQMNGYQKHPNHLDSTRSTPGLKARTVTPATGAGKKKLVTGDWLNDATVRGTKNRKVDPSRKPKAINTYSVSGFNGSVPVPKPSAMFSRVENGLPQQPSAKTTNGSKPDTQAILAKQQEMAGRIRVQQMTGTKTKAGKKNAESSKTVPKPANFYDSVGGISIEGMMEARSKFCNEVDAEEYARSRKIVSELEEKEEKEISRKTKSKRAVVEKEWVCQTCRRSSQAKPIGCVRQHHIVVPIRKISASKTATDQRLSLNEKSAAQGGLTLGTGINWSKNKWSRFN